MSKLRRNKTRYISHLDRCAQVCMDKLPAEVAEYIVICAGLIDEYRRSQARLKDLIERQKAEILNLLSEHGKKPYARDLLLYTEHPDTWRLTEQTAPDGIVLSSTHRYIQRRIDVKRLRAKYPESMEAFMKDVQCKGRLMTGNELFNLTSDAYDGGDQ